MYLGKYRIDARLEKRYENHNEQRIDRLHLVGQQHPTAYLAVHSRCLKRPLRTLLIVQRPKYRQRYEHFQNSQRGLNIVNQRPFIYIISMIEPMIAFRFVLHFIVDRVLVFMRKKNSK